MRALQAGATLVRSTVLPTFARPLAAGVEEEDSEEESSEESLDNGRPRPAMTERSGYTMATGARAVRNGRVPHHTRRCAHCKEKARAPPYAQGRAPSGAGVCTARYRCVHKKAQMSVCCVSCVCMLEGAGAATYECCVPTCGCCLSTHGCCSSTEPGIIAKDACWHNT